MPSENRYCKGAIISVVKLKLFRILLAQLSGGDTDMQQTIIKEMPKNKSQKADKLKYSNHKNQKHIFNLYT